MRGLQTLQSETLLLESQLPNAMATLSLLAHTQAQFDKSAKSGSAGGIAEAEKDPPLASVEGTAASNFATEVARSYAKDAREVKALADMVCNASRSFLVCAVTCHADRTSAPSGRRCAASNG